MKRSLEEDIEKADPSAPASCRIYNGTPSLVGQSWELHLKYRVEGNSGECMTGVTSIQPGEWVTVTLPAASPFNKEEKIDPESGRIQVKKDGLVFEGGLKEVKVDGKDYKLIVDDSCPPLTEEEYEKANGMLLDVLEGRAAIKLSELGSHGFGRAKKPAEKQLWTWVTTEIGRNPTDEIVETVQKMVCEGSCKKDGRKRCREAMLDHPQRPVPSSTLSKDQAKKVLSDGKATIVIYHRAIDRFPGGNSDQHIVRHTFDLSSTDGIAFHYFDWDGSSEVSVKPIVMEEVGEDARNVIVPKLIELLDNSDGERDFEYTVSDTQTDSDEYDTEWSSIEVLVYEGKPENGKLIARINQYAIYPNWYSFMGEKATVSDVKLPAPGVEEVMKAVEDVLMMGRVEKFSESESQGRQTFADTQYFHLPWLGYVMPIYL